MTQNIYTKSKEYDKKEIQRGIVSFMRERGNEVSNEEVSDFIFNKWGIRFGQISHVMNRLREDDERVIRSEKLGYSKLIPEAMADN
ncbi:hypothetical protein [Peribacillus butanolivorans]|uniref:hypothetical protein n=1 Tax=Peribacillus butanolivorans TaxID=421767 RepID=UPI0036DA516D